jgi:uncharacterized protein (TIGR00290 family)
MYLNINNKIALSWSGGKDSALALYELCRNGGYEPRCLLTIVTQEYDRVNIHGVRKVLIERQAALLGLPLKFVFISKQASNEEYEKKMAKALATLRQEGISAVAFGDIFLADLRRCRQEQAAGAGLKAVFPNWKRNTQRLARRFIGLGFRAVVTCVDSHSLDKSFAGRTFDGQFMNDLPPGVDPCGENGEFHSFVFEGPLFKEALKIQTGEVMLREGRFYYCELQSEGY